jgi:hypothetical protein
LTLLAARPGPTRYRVLNCRQMAFSALVFPMLVITLTAGVFLTARRSATPVRAFRSSFILTFVLVLFTPWMGGYSPEPAMVNATVAGGMAAGMWWLLQRRALSEAIRSTPSR